MVIIHSSVDGHLGCFRLLAIVINAAVNTGVQISLQDPAFHFFGYISRSGIAGSYANTMRNFLRNRHTVLCTILLQPANVFIPVSPEAGSAPLLILQEITSDPRHSDKETSQQTTYTLRFFCPEFPDRRPP